ncbi:putative cellulose synthase (UDP-forming) [Medicago truncatula]|uniref:Cellulose synthase H1-like protein n=1 Tax=Medicago truncatula TaxID=3880 RepID=A0A072UKU0_MEDTR|nr:cellulose synthase-like protein H1 isoform X2 [Medicago truncatula]KEH29713.1 cellulose synthase H1-like protein [Medicago truncatula]RHN60380.1 putative cellulose synthase (UDP-forming) [Medicago truncatula]
MANPNSLPLYEKYWYKHNYKRVLDSLILILLLLLLGYRVMYVNNYSIPWFIALICETWFTLSWIFTISTQWSPAFIKTNPDRLLQSVQELPAVDLFVTTADDELEPAIITINTVLSLLALDYPSHKLACYVSDDGCSPLIFYALHKASKFAKHWVPFCKKYNVQIRAPFRYFCDDNDCTTNDEEFRQEWLQMKDLYENLSHKIDVDPKSIPSLLEEEFAVFSNTNRTNHPAIIKVIWENKEMAEDGLPHLIYISREKRPKQPHHFKAGAMNVLTRVSGLITNAPFMLNVDCDMFVNNPNIVMHALCILLDSKGEKEVAFAQCPQQFYATLKDDPFGNQMAILYKYLGAGLAGLQGIFYGGTNCFHRRKVIYGLSPDDVEKGNNLSEVELKQKFGTSKELMKSVGHALEDRTYSASDISVNKAVEEAIHVASYGYEYGTGWGKQVGWMYGTMTEDILTGLTIHKKGWRSELCTPDPIAFTGCAPIDGPTCMAQHKRWATGMLEIFFSKHCPVFGAIFDKLSFRQFLAYMWIMNWGFSPVAQVCYACLVAYCIITNSYFLPKDWGMYIPTAIFGIYKVYTLYEYLASGLSIKAWWNNQRMSRITPMNAGFCGFITVLLKLLGISNTVFDITKKELPPSRDDRHDKNAGRYTFNESLVFLPGTTILLLQLTAIFIKLFGFQPQGLSRNYECGLAEMLISVYLIICYWPFLRGLFETGKFGIPLSTICKGATLTCIFVCLSRRTISG